MGDSQASPLIDDDNVNDDHSSDEHDDENDIEDDGKDDRDDIEDDFEDDVKDDSEDDSEDDVKDDSEDDSEDDVKDDSEDDRVCSQLHPPSECMWHNCYKRATVPDWRDPLPELASLPADHRVEYSILLDGGLESDFFFRFTAYPRGSKSLPYKVRQDLSQHVMDTLETTCFEHVRLDEPDWLEVLRLDSADDCEVHNWLEVCTRMPGSKFIGFTKNLSLLRHTVVHRKSLPIYALRASMVLLLQLGELPKAQALDGVVRLVYFDSSIAPMSYQLSGRGAAASALQLVRSDPTTYHGILLKTQTLVEDLLCTFDNRSSGASCEEGLDWEDFQKHLDARSKQLIEGWAERTKFVELLGRLRKLRNAQAHRHTVPNDVLDAVELVEMIEAEIERSNEHSDTWLSEVRLVARQIRAMQPLAEAIRLKLTDEQLMRPRRLEQEADFRRSRYLYHEASFRFDWLKTWVDAETGDTMGSDASKFLWPRILESQEQFLRLSRYDPETDKWPDGMRLLGDEELEKRQEIEARREAYAEEMRKLEETRNSITYKARLCLETLWRRFVKVVTRGRKPDDGIDPWSTPLWPSADLW